MSITTTVEDGKIGLPPGIDWPDRTVVRIETVKNQPTNIREALKKFEGVADELPTDLAANHDHSIHGHPKA